MIRNETTDPIPFITEGSSAVALALDTDFEVGWAAGFAGALATAVTTAYTQQHP